VTSGEPLLHLLGRLARVPLTAGARNLSTTLRQLPEGITDPPPSAHVAC
jgi:pyridoxal biosynthesis lyase PdxS